MSKSDRKSVSEREQAQGDECDENEEKQINEKDSKRKCNVESSNAMKKWRENKYRGALTTTTITMTTAG